VQKQCYVVLSTITKSVKIQRAVILVFVEKLHSKNFYSNYLVEIKSTRCSDSGTKSTVKTTDVVHVFRRTVRKYVAMIYFDTSFKSPAGTTTAVVKNSSVQRL
jgi:hypothetical protein